MSARRVRKTPLLERLQNQLNPYDWLLYLSEELQTSDWAKLQGKWSIFIGLECNLLFMIACSNSTSRRYIDDEVFGDYTHRAGSGWFGWSCFLLVWMLGTGSTVNALYTLVCKRSYRLFERSLEEIPHTPSARRVRVDDSPIAQASPLKYLADVLSFGSAESCAHPDQARDVVELRIWDPPPICLRLFTLFSPAHVLIYMSFLPTRPADPIPSLTIFKTIFLGFLASAQSYALESSFTQQAKDKLILNKEVLHEYDSKYVHPSINRPARDVAIQTLPSKTSHKKEMGTDPMVSPTSEVDVSKPYTIINRGFRTNPNPAYAAHYDKENTLGLQNASSYDPALRTPATATAYSPYSGTGATQTGALSDFSSPLRPPVQLPFPSIATKQSRNGDGGSLGVYTSSHSPLRKAASHRQMRRERDVHGLAERVGHKEGSPLKRSSLPGNREDNGAAVGNGNSALNGRLKQLRGTQDGSSSGWRQSERF